MYQGKYLNPNTVRKKKSKVKHSKKATVIFYSFYGALILAFLIGMIVLTSWLKGWLVEFEAAQPDNASVEVFNQHFAEPDWIQLFNMADKLEGQSFDSAEDYAAFMEKQLEGARITMVETSAGLSGGRKYIARGVYSDDSYYDFATFTLMDKKPEGEVISDWQLSEVVLRVQIGHNSDDPSTTYDYFIRIDPANTVTVNGVKLDESHIIRTVTTKAEEYLPEGMTGYRMVELYIDGLTAQPEVKITDAKGSDVAFTYDEQSRTYAQDLTQGQIPEEEKSALLSAATSYCKYMIRASDSRITSWFDTTTDIYKTITKTDSWMQGYSGYQFGDQKVSGYYRYSDSLFSAKVELTLNVTRKNGTVKVYELDTTFFMENQNGKWKVVEMTNVDVQEQIVQVRMTYLHTDGSQIQSEMVDANAKRLSTPVVTAPEGQMFRGWATKSVGEDGQNIFTLIYQPAEDGTVTLPMQNTLEPTVLYAVFGEG